MKLLLLYLFVLATILGVAVYASKRYPKPCWCWPTDGVPVAAAQPRPVSNQYVSYGSYGSEVDWNDPQRIIPLDYTQTQGKLLYYQQCVWCHSDSTPAGPSNRSNVTPTPPLMNDGAVLNQESDAFLQKVIAEGGKAAGKSEMMPPYGKSLTPDEIRDLIAYIRVIAVPAYRPVPDRNRSAAYLAKIRPIWKSLNRGSE